MYSFVSGMIVVNGNVKNKTGVDKLNFKCQSLAALKTISSKSMPDATFLLYLRTIAERTMAP